MDKKILEIVNQEVAERTKQNKIITVCQQIVSVKKKISENEIQLTLQDKEISSLKKDCSDLRTDIELLKELISRFKTKVELQQTVLIKETNLLENTQQEVWDKLLSFINKCREPTPSNMDNEVQEFIKSRKCAREVSKLKMEVLSLEGKVQAQKMYKQFQENHLKTITDSFNPRDLEYDIDLLKSEFGDDSDFEWH